MSNLIEMLYKSASETSLVDQSDESLLSILWEQMALTSGSTKAALTKRAIDLLIEEIVYGGSK